VRVETPLVLAVAQVKPRLVLLPLAKSLLWLYLLLRHVFPLVLGVLVAVARVKPPPVLLTLAKSLVWLPLLLRHVFPLVLAVSPRSLVGYVALLPRVRLAVTELSLVLLLPLALLPRVRLAVTELSLVL
jgi:hypothetical protein